jgi:hypothetical protein
LAFSPGANATQCGYTFDSAQDAGHLQEKLGVCKLKAFFLFWERDAGKFRAPAARGPIQIQLAPSTKGTDNGSLTIVSDASNSPLKISLTGTGIESGLVVSPASLNFGNVKVGQMTTQAVKLTNGGNIDLVVNSAQVSGNGSA